MIKRLFLLLLLTSCYRVADRIEPKVSFQLKEVHLQKLDSAFTPLKEEEKKTDWGKEYIIAKAFAEDLDLYRAVSTFKRAQILAPKQSERSLEIDYDILLCYFLAGRYPDVTNAFEKTDLSRVDPSFQAYHDLLLVLYESYREQKEIDKQERIQELIGKSFPITSEELKVSEALRDANLTALQEIAKGFHRESYLDDLQTNYQQNKKSVARAQLLNALLPGAGYFYIGQKKSALTAFLLNGLFITAAVQFFLHKHIAAGIITTGFEAGWYFGGIYGAGEEAKYYNERLYETSASSALNEQKLFPIFMLEHAF